MENVLQALMVPEYWDAFEWSDALALNGIDYSENTFPSFREWIVISFSVFATRNTRLSL